MTMNRLRRGIVAGVAAGLLAGPAFAQKKYDTGANDKEIVIGGISPYSGPASAYGTIGKGIGAYFDKVNAEGGVNGRKLKWVSYDDGYNPAKTVEMARKLVEQDEVLLIFNVLGTPPNSAIHKYLNQKKVPQLFNATGATKWGDPKNFPWTMGWQPSYQSEGRIYAQHVLETKPNAKVAVLYQNDDYGKDYLKGFEDGLGDKAKTMIIKKITYEVTDPTIDSQLVELKSSGADVFFNITTPKFAAQAIKKAADIGWKPVHYLNGVSSSVGSVIMPAGPQNAVDVITAYYLKDPTDSQWQATQEYKDWLAWMQKHHPSGDLKDANNVFAYTVAQTMVEVLKRAGDNLTRENIMKVSANLDLTLPMLLPGVNVKTSPEDFFPIERQQLQRWDGKQWVRFGKIYGP
ncbi:ABC transporter substrate-binding protein [Quisquiliibacterium transsilvanicum]|jgi:ABC-type branched-subunit amino acid transport system substrate-binding protein|uniref:ABC-type branched-subunit amino acid transport system substrate-binding protein n=2 Tax=Quisquiliibacterium transsilvanicum TaxID=1549638 RepID=A0A7W8HGN5_9BURK|nr:ABC transporter substrate-binding protein [Quisquiliibacterium transsilvanicum]MBB5271744.1 ABC-type branched-subunit amino acid transport system substrate-binding protein [Quisquiliibacterium transsilvanicum]